MTQPLPQQFVTTMAKRVYRMHHFLWHELRDEWPFYADDTRKKIRELGWEPPRPAVDENNVAVTDASEDFLYLHCEWNSLANRILADAGDAAYPRIEGWVTIPGPGDSEYPVPPAWFSPESQPITNSFVARAKSDDYFERRIRYWERMCTDPVYLTEVSLAELAAIIEANVYDAVRYRWASEPAAMRPDPPTPGEPISDGWDEPRYDHLPDTYSMHLHPVYWKFHGWVADRVEDWKVANGVSGRDFWKATWVGKLPDDLQPSGRCPPAARDLNPLFAALLDEDVAGRHLEEMEQVVAIIAEAEVADQ